MMNDCCFRQKMDGEAGLEFFEVGKVSGEWTQTIWTSLWSVDLEGNEECTFHFSVCGFEYAHSGRQSWNGHLEPQAHLRGEDPSLHLKQSYLPHTSLWPSSLLLLLPCSWGCRWQDSTWVWGLYRRRILHHPGQESGRMQVTCKCRQGAHRRGWRLPSGRSRWLGPSYAPPQSASAAQLRGLRHRRWWWRRWAPGGPPHPSQRAPAHRQLCQHKPTSTVKAPHRRSVQSSVSHSRGTAGSVQSGWRRWVTLPARRQPPGAGRSGHSWAPGSAEGYRWPRSGHRPWGPAECTLQPPGTWRKTFVLHSLQMRCLSIQRGSLLSSWGQWLRWRRCPRRIAGWGGSTWVCGAGHLPRSGGPWQHCRPWKVCRWPPPC